MLLPDLPLWVPVALDTETNGLYADSGARVSVVSLAWVSPSLLQGGGSLRDAVFRGSGVHSVALPFSQGIWTGRHGLKDGETPSLFTDDTDNPNLGADSWLGLLSWLEGRRIVMHHGKFDTEKMRYAPLGWDPFVPGIDLLDQWIWDTQVVSPELWPQETSALKPTADRLWGEGESGEAAALKPYLGPKTNPRYDLVPWDVMQRYAAKDANQTIRLYYHQLARLGLLSDGYAEADWVLWEQCRKQIDTAKALYRMERAGIPYDAGASLEAAARLEARQREIDRALPFRPTGPQAARWFFTDKPVKRPTGGYATGPNLVPVALTKTGAPQFTEQVVQGLARAHVETTPAGKVARQWLERAKLANAVKMWYKPYAEGLGSDGRLRTCFRQVTRGRGTEDGGTRSGRFSVERVNLQAIPHDYRLKAVTDLVPSPRAMIGSAAARLEGWELWEFDLAQAELRLAAAWSNCYTMLSAFAEGRDLHGETTEELFKVKKSHPDWGMYRQIGKRANFTLCFGAGGETFAKMVRKETGMEMSDDEADYLVRQWNRLYPEFGRAISLWSEHAERTGSVPLASVAGFGTGRLRRFDHQERRAGLHKAFNQLVQGSLGEFAKDWNLSTQAVCDRAGLGFVEGIGWTGLCLVIHDSQVMLLPAGDRGDEIAAEAVERCRVLWSRFFETPDPAGRVETVAGYSEGKRWG